MVPTRIASGIANKGFIKIFAPKIKPTKYTDSSKELSKLFIKFGKFQTNKEIIKSIKGKKYNHTFKEFPMACCFTLKSTLLSSFAITHFKACVALPSATVANVNIF